MIGARRLIDDPRDDAAGEPFDQHREALAVVVEARAAALGMEMNVKLLFGDVDAQGLWHARSHLFPFLCLSSEAEPRVSVQATGKREGWSHSRSARNGRRPFDPSPPAAGEWRLAGGNSILCRNAPRIIRQASFETQGFASPSGWGSGSRSASALTRSGHPSRCFSKREVFSSFYDSSGQSAVRPSSQGSKGA